MEIPVIGMCDGAMYASYEGWYGEGGDVYVTGGATEWGGGGGVTFVYVWREESGSGRGGRRGAGRSEGAQYRPHR